MRLRPLLALSLLAACGKATFPAARLPEAVRELCLKEQKIDVRAQLVGKTLYIACDLEGLVTDDLDFRRDTLETFEGLMLSGTRASLSTDATVDFLVVQAKDPRLKASITILRYIPDIKGLIYMRYSRSDFEDRMVLESDAESTEASTATWHDVDVAEFMARLVASRLQRRLSGRRWREPWSHTSHRLDATASRCGGGRVRRRRGHRRQQQCRCHSREEALPSA